MYPVKVPKYALLFIISVKLVVLKKALLIPVIYIASNTFCYLASVLRKASEELVKIIWWVVHAQRTPYRDPCTGGTGCANVITHYLCNKLHYHCQRTVSPDKR